MRLERFQIHDDEGRPQIVRMKEVLATRHTADQQSIELRTGWISVCMLLGCLLLAIAVLHLILMGNQWATTGFRWSYLLVLVLALGEVVLAFWLFSKRARWVIDGEVIRRWRTKPWSAPPQEWAAEDVEAVLIVEQGNFSVRFQALAPGIWLKTSGRPVDLGASKDAEAVRAIAESIAALLGVPLRDETRPGIFEKFMSARRRSVFVYCVIGVVVAGGLWWLRRQ